MQKKYFVISIFGLPIDLPIERVIIVAIKIIDVT